MSQARPVEVLLGLDIGSKRIGVASARSDVRISSPLTTVAAGPDAVTTLQGIISREQAVRLVVGLPRGLSGQTTAQTVSTQWFADQLQRATGLPVELQDEALTSVKAEAELKQRGKPYDKAAVDALAATYILQDYLEHADV